MANDQLNSAAFRAQLFAQSSSVASSEAQLGSLTSAGKKSAGGMGASEARAAADDFEAVFLQTMLTPMFSGTQAAEPFGGGFAEETWQGFLVEEYAKTITASGGVGISDAIFAELMSVQEQFNDSSD